jgi:hypothetical protein
MPYTYRVSRGVAVVIALAMLGLTAQAFAAAQRTFVASTGSDVGPPPCSLALPCLSFNVAISQTLPGGEVVILDTAGYGPMTINKSPKVIGPTGVYGGISVLGGANPTTGIVINAGDTDVVILRGLDVSGVPGAAPLPLYKSALIARSIVSWSFSLVLTRPWIVAKPRRRNATEFKSLSIRVDGVASTG